MPIEESSVGSMVSTKTLGLTWENIEFRLLSLITKGLLSDGFVIKGVEGLGLDRVGDRVAFIFLRWGPKIPGIGLGDEVISFGGFPRISFSALGCFIFCGGGPRLPFKGEGILEILSGLDLVLYLEK